jgi:hypothetical protein
MVVQIVQFQLAGISPAEYAAHAERVAPIIVDMPGLVAKAWLGDPGTGTYLWADRASAEAYTESEPFQAASRNPAFAGFRSEIYDTLAVPTAVTARGLAAA